MKLLVEFDMDADIIDVPQIVIDNRERYRSSFLKWLYNKGTKHAYRKTEKDTSGIKRTFYYYRADAFVKWLNKKVLKDSEEKAAVLEIHTWDDSGELPSIFF